MKIGDLDQAVFDGLTTREKTVLEVIDRVSVFGGREVGKIEAGEALEAKRLGDIFTDPEDRAIATSLLQRFFPDLEEKSVGRVHGPGMAKEQSTRLGRLFRPRSIAVIGASADAEKVGGTVVKNLLASKFPGKLHLVNPKGGKIQGLPVTTALEDLPKVDLAVITIPNEKVKGALEALAKKGVKNVIIITAGFGESGPEGKAKEAELVAIAKEHGINLVGPNCVGVITPTMNASFASGTPKWGGVALVSQSGSVVTGMLSDLHKTGFTALVSMGNQAGLDISDYTAELGQDPRTKVIALYAERIADGKRFVETAGEVSRKKPIVILKSGKTAAGAKASMSHTGSIGGSRAAYDAAFRRAGVMVAEDQEELLDVTKVFASKAPIPKGRRLAVMTNAGGLGILTADAAGKYALEIAELSPETQKKLRAIVPEEVHVGNPTDLLGDAKSDRYLAAGRVILDDPNVDGIICLSSPQGMTDPEGIAKAVVELSKDAKKPILCSFQGEADMAVAAQILDLAGVPNLPTGERVARAMARMAEQNEIASRPPYEPAKTKLDTNALAKAEKAIGLSKGGKLGTEALELFRSQGIDIVERRIAGDVEAAVKHAKEIGFPVAMKIRSPEITHKSDVGGVQLQIASEDDLRKRYATMMDRVKKERPEAKIEGVEIQQQIPEGRDVILGMVRDPSFGPVIMFGLGGTMVEVFKDTTFELAPLSEETIRAMIERIKSYPILAGARGEKPVDFEALKDALRKLSALSVHYGDRLQELDINPLRLYPDGAVALDARASFA
jgi:acetate---CoA ligase (ADP-forming)